MRKVRLTPFGAIVVVGLVVTGVLAVILPGQGVFVALALLLAVLLLGQASSLSAVRYGQFGSKRDDLGKTPVEMTQREHGLRDI